MHKRWKLVSITSFETKAILHDKLYTHIHRFVCMYLSTENTNEISLCKIIYSYKLSNYCFIHKKIDYSIIVITHILTFNAFVHVNGCLFDQNFNHNNVITVFNTPIYPFTYFKVVVSESNWSDRYDITITSVN